ncbi:MAG: helix-turn-helix domain-containing protein [Acidimicrobiia bacterium]
MSEQRRRAFAETLFRALSVSDTRQGDLSAALGISQSTVSQWVTAKNAPDSEMVFALEVHLKLPPEHLSRHLGYLYGVVADTFPAISIHYRVSIHYLGTRPGLTQLHSGP